MLGLPLQTPAPDWRLKYETSHYLETGRYAEAVNFCQKLQAASPYAKVIKYGVTGEGRPMVALILSRDKTFIPAQAAKSSKPLVLINNGIHPGEIEGKDADLMYARAILISKKEAAILNKVNLIVIPVFNIDGHERFGPYNRINQNGPKQMGWRVTSMNLNLNRDYIKADAPEMRAWLKLFHDWNPDFFFDNHTTDGGDWQYDVALSVPVGPTQNASVAAWTRRMMATVEPMVRKDGHLTSPYFGGFDNAHPEKGFTTDDYTPRYSTGYGSAVNRPTMLVETHVLKPYKQRVEATYSVNKRVIEFIAKSGPELKKINRTADIWSAKGLEGHDVVLSAKLNGKWRPFDFLGYEFKPYMSEVSGAEISAWNKKTPITVKSRIQDEFEPNLSVRAPYAYAIPPQWTDVVRVLNTHGIPYRRTKAPMTAKFATYSFTGVKYPSIPFEGRFSPNFTAKLIAETRTLPPGTVVVGTGHPLGKLVMHILEPQAPDSLMRWGFFNAITEDKEFFEDYAMEPIAKKMLETDENLRKEFQQKLKDPAFANNPRERLAFFYDRSKFADSRKNKYPVVRLSKSQTEKLK